ncbi:MAG TPA: MmgE/PrpD family protein [Phycisphaerales bacterium]|nr:MmgE/PrpD family protein [Phycisphaerales bacterium]
MTTTLQPAPVSANSANQRLLARNTNQALGIGQFACDFMQSSVGAPASSVLQRTAMFHTDAALCGLSALALGTNAPLILRHEAMSLYPRQSWDRPAGGAPVFGSTQLCAPEKAIAANSSAVREWDSNGTNFGFNPRLNHTAGEFGHNDFYPVAVAAAQIANEPGSFALRGMVLLDEIRGRLAEVFSLKTYKIDHVVHGAIASAATYGAMLGATAEQIESAIGMFVAHYIPWRAIRAGKQLSDSKGASAAISTEAAILSMQRSMLGFVGPRDIFRNPEAIFRFFEPTTQGKERWKELGDSPFDLIFSHSGDDFAVMGMHFKLGLYEHQSAGALQGIIDLVAKHPDLLSDSQGHNIKEIKILAYEPAFGIIGNPAKMDPKTRQSADHSMAYIVATLLRKALEYRAKHGSLPSSGGKEGGAHDETWKTLMLMPADYKVDASAIFHPLTRALMQKIRFEHGGPDYDKRYPDGIPTSLVVTTSAGKTLDSGLVMYPAGHARNATANLNDILARKFELLGNLALRNPKPVIERFNNIANLSASELRNLYAFELLDHGRFE